MRVSMSILCSAYLLSLKKFCFEEKKMTLKHWVVLRKRR
jgi:hypothetical protein